MAGVPKCVLVMRHAEKPDDPRDPDLSQEGFARADALATYIPAKFGAIDTIFASAISKNSNRPLETVTPLADRLGLKIDATIADQDYPVLADDLVNTGVYGGQQVVVCWHHGNIPSMMRDLGAPARSYPDPWDPAVFDLILQVTFDAAGKVSVIQATEDFK